MSNIQTYLDELRNALYGEEVRSAIINAINQCYQDVTDGIRPVITFDALENGTRVNVAVGDNKSSFSITNGSDIRLTTLKVSSSQVNCAAGASGHVDIPVTFSDSDHTFVSVVRTWSDNGTVYTHSNTTALADGGNVRVNWANWSSSTQTVTLNAMILFSYREQSETSDTALRNLMYPVGSVYISTNNVNPSTLFGGTWRAIGQGRTLVGVGSIEANSVATHGSVTAGEFSPEVNEKGGEMKHTLTVNELPSHAHSIAAYATSNESANFGLTHSNIEGFNDRVIVTGGPMSTASTGGNESHNVIQPYLAVYIWERTA